MALGAREKMTHDVKASHEKLYSVLRVDDDKITQRFESAIQKVCNYLSKWQSIADFTKSYNKIIKFIFRTSFKFTHEYILFSSNTSHILAVMGNHLMQAVYTVNQPMSAR